MSNFAFCQSDDGRDVPRRIARKPIPLGLQASRELRQRIREPTCFDFKRRTVTLSNSGLPYPVRCTDDDCGQIELPGVPLGSFSGVTYDEVTLPLRAGELFVFCTDGIFEAANEEGKEYGAKRLCDVVRENRKATAREIVDAIFDSVILFRGTAPQNDDMTAVAVKIIA